MDHRGRSRRDPGRHPHRGNPESHPRPQERDPHYPPPDPRDQDRHWGHPEAHYRSQVRPEQYQYTTQHFGYGRPDYQRPPSRHDYAPHSLWDYRDSYAYHDYYRGQQGAAAAAAAGHDCLGQWGPQDSWRPDQYYERPHRLEPPGGTYREEHRYDHGKETSLHYLQDYEETPYRDNEDVSSYYHGTLESSKNSGLSSSSCELSQYMNGANHTDPQPAELVHRASAPLKFSIPHAVVSFGPAGQLVRVSPGSSMQENVSQLEIHSLEVMLSETREQHEMRSFPGPLTREDLHKVDAIEFAHQMAAACMKDEELLDRSSAALLWNLLILLCRQNGQIVGSDIAELLMQGSRPDGSWEAEAPTLIDFDEDATTEAPPQQGDDLLTGGSATFSQASSGKLLQNYTRLLLAGRKKEALEEAMSGSLWGHALFLASKMDNRSYTTVLNRFTGQLTSSDPLQTLFQLLSGRTPAVATCCGNEKWGDWKPHLAVMLSNETGDPGVQQKAVVTMGDTLASRGLIHAAHVCYLTAGAPFGAFTRKSERLVLLGSSHRQPLQHFATNSAIQCTELYEYCQALLDKSFSIPSFQVYKFLYAIRLLDCGLSSQAFHYCEVVGRALLRQRKPHFVLTGELIKLSDRLMSSEDQLNEGLSGATLDPDWLKHLRARFHSLQMGTSDPTGGYLPPPGASTWAPEEGKQYSESDLDDLHRDTQSPEPELLYYRGAEEPESLLHQTVGVSENVAAPPWGVSAPQDWPPASAAWVPAPVVGTPPTPAGAAGQHLSYHSTDGTEVGGGASHCPQRHLPSAAEGLQLSSGAATMAAPGMGVDIGHHRQSQPGLPGGFEDLQQTSEPVKQSAKTGWFSGWFKSNTKDIQRETETPQTELPPTSGLHPPPPPPPAASIGPPSMFPSAQPPPAGINPFSRKAGQQLG